MNKRSHEEPQVGNKRRKFDNENQAAPISVPISSSQELRQLLTFRQDATQELRNGIQSFKVLLESIARTEREEENAKRLSVLKEYLKSQNARRDSETVVLPELMKTWSFAADTNNDNLFSESSSVIALLIKTISSLIDFRDEGVAIGKSLLQEAHLKLLSRGLSAPQHKKHVISPCLRLLSEVVSFDGGVLAKKLFSCRASVLDAKVLAKNLSLSNPPSEDSGDTQRKPSVRDNAVSYLLACLSHLPSSAKSEVLKYSQVFRALFDRLKDDPPALLKRIFDVLRTHVLSDELIHRSHKSYLLNDRNLSNIASLYRTEHKPTTGTTETKSPETLAHEFLRFACLDPSAGLLRINAGWYPPGTDKDFAEADASGDDIDLGLDSIEWHSRYNTEVPVRNVNIANLLQTLRPYSNNLERELTLELFQAAPELVADYFFKRTGFNFDPKPTATWIGYSSFLFSVVRLSVPKYFGRKDGYGKLPPPTSITIESILPQPLTQKVLTRCLNQPVKLIAFFALRLTIVAFHKIQLVLEHFERAAAEQGTLWREATTRLRAEFSLRCPKMKDVISVFKCTTHDDLLHREAVLRLLKLYYHVMPEVALEEKFDVSIPLAEELRFYSVDTALESATDHPQDDLRFLILNHLLEISRWTPDMRWWQTPQQLKYSPFTTLLEIIAKAPPERTSRDMRLLLDSIIKENNILQQQTERSSTDALIVSLRASQDWSASEKVFEFLDNVFGRLVRKPIKYEDDFEAMIAEESSAGPVSLLWMTIVEQFPFLADRECENVSIWVGRFMRFSEAIGEDQKILMQIKSALQRAPSDINLTQGIERANDQDLQQELTELASLSMSDLGRSNIKTPNGIEETDMMIDIDSFAPPEEEEKHPGLHRWSDKEVSDAVEEGDLSELILCLSSAYPEVRDQALINLNQFMTRLDAAKEQYSDAQQIYLLLGILTNTVTTILTHQRQTQPNTHIQIPHLVTAHATLAIPILTNPLHPLYTKLAHFHTLTPSWMPPLTRLPSTLTTALLSQPPTDDPGTALSRGQADPFTAARTAGLLHLLRYILAGLRTRADMDILRRSDAVEPLLALAADPFCGREVREAVLRVVWRATFLDGGSTTLVTRFGAVAWVGGLIQQAAQGEGLTGQRALKMLASRLWETCDREWVGKWSTGGMEGMVKGIVGDEVWAE